MHHIHNALGKITGKTPINYSGTNFHHSYIIKLSPSKVYSEKGFSCCKDQ